MKATEASKTQKKPSTQLTPKTQLIQTTENVLSKKPKKYLRNTTKADQFLKQLILEKENLEKGFIKFAKLLSEAYHSGDKDPSKSYIRIWGFPNFVEFAEKKLGWKFRTAYQYVAIWDTIEKYNITESDAVQIGSSKLSLITTFANYSHVTRKQVITACHIAMETPYEEFKEWLIMARGQKDLPDNKTYTYRRFKIPTEYAPLTNGAINKAKQILAESTENSIENIPDEEALFSIIKEWTELKGLKSEIEHDIEENKKQQQEIEKQKLFLEQQNKNVTPTKRGRPKKNNQDTNTNKKTITNKTAA